MLVSIFEGLTHGRSAVQAVKMVAVGLRVKITGFSRSHLIAALRKLVLHGVHVKYAIDAVSGQVYM